MPQVNETTSPDSDDFQAFYQHEKRPEWGVAILAWDRRDKRGYQFDDGKLRIFKRGYYNLLKEVDPPEGVAGELLDELNRRLHESRETTSRKKPPKPLEPVYPFEDQIIIFNKMYPDGFLGAQWSDRIRGTGAKKRLKRHRDPAIKQATELLASERLNDLIDAGQHGEVWRSALAVLDATNLVASARVKTAAEISESGEQIVAKALRALLYGKNTYGRRFSNFGRSLKAAGAPRPSWRLATAIPALVRPEKHVCVQPSMFRKQAGELAPRLVYEKRPTRKSYKNYRRVAKAARRLLIEEGFQPRDFLDIHDFIWCTLRPAAAKHLDRG